MPFAYELILFVQALFPQPLHIDLIQFKDDIGVILDHGKAHAKGIELERGLLYTICKPNAYRLSASD